MRSLLITGLVLLALLEDTVTGESVRCPPRLCTKEYKPVCGSNGETYSNLCLFEDAQCRVEGLTYTEGKCKDKGKRRCPRSCKGKGKYKPICGTDGKIYKNRCQFRKAKCNDPALKRSKGKCKDESDPCSRPCTKQNKPVCGSNGKTYGNLCLFRNAQCRVKGLTHTKGKCKDDGNK